MKMTPLLKLPVLTNNIVIYTNHQIGKLGISQNAYLLLKLHAP